MKTNRFLLAAGIVLAMAFTFSCSSDDGDGGGGGSVTYEGQKYKTVKIGEQVWFAENLNYAGDDNSSIGTCYKNDPVNCTEYGRLYTWSEANAICPNGWHLPSREEWEVMTAYIGGADTEGKKLKAKSGWRGSGNGTDEYGFSALPGGHLILEGYDYIGGSGYWWSASESNSNNAYYRRMHYDHDYANWYSDLKSERASVRCLQD
jgi:uncharacterized protein (TIGR02145 family)